MQKQSGFTLIELVIVLVLLGILAAVAVPRFIDLSEQAEESAVRAQASALASGSAINFAAWVGAGRPDPFDPEDYAFVEVTGCEDAADVVENFDDVRFDLTATDPADGVYAPFTLLTVPDGASVDCFVALN